MLTPQSLNIYISCNCYSVNGYNSNPYCTVLYTYLHCAKSLALCPNLLYLHHVHMFYGCYIFAGNEDDYTDKMVLTTIPNNMTSSSVWGTRSMLYKCLKDVRCQSFSCNVAGKCHLSHHALGAIQTNRQRYNDAFDFIGSRGMLFS